MMGVGIVWRAKKREKKAQEKRALRQSRIKQIKDHFGACCFLCGYDTNYAAFDFHHLRDKSFPVNTITIEKSTAALEAELKKCVLLCRNCHADIHNLALSKNPSRTLENLEKIQKFIPNFEPFKFK